MPLKIAIIGAGSIGFARRLFRDVLSVPELQDTEFALHDISNRNLDMVRQLCEKDLKNNKLPAKIKVSTNRRKSLEGADYVINCTRIGGLEAFEHDINIPLKYGVDQCVGDTLSAGGIMYGQRNIPCILDFCKDIREVASNKALFINYANPMAMNTWAAIKYGKVNTIGLCHGIEGGWRVLADALGGTTADITGICAGINHQTWYTRILFKGREIGAEELIKALESHPKHSRSEKCRIDVLKRFGYFSTESNGHLSEYLPWYRKRPKEIKDWICLDSWIYGETGGYLRVCTEGRNWFESDFPSWLNREDKPIGPADRSHERGSYIIEALETGRTLRTYVNTINNGVITNLPSDAIIEAPCYIDKLGIHMPSVGDLPLACAATCNVSINVQRMAVEAAVHGDVTLLKQAMLHDPLVGAVCNPPEIWQMTDEMLVAQARWLPQYKSAIPAAKKRLASSSIKTKSYAGAARIKVKSVAEMRKAYDKLKTDAGDRDNLKTVKAKLVK